MFTQIMNNVAILITLSVVYGVLYRYLRNQSYWRHAACGILFGGIAVVVMIIPIQLRPGIIFDTRSVIICLAAAFEGPIAGLMTFGIASAYRVFAIGGVGAAPALAMHGIVMLLGMLYFIWRRDKQKGYRYLDFILLGLIAHTAMGLCILLLPWPMAFEVLKKMSPVVLGILPLVTLFMAKLINDQRTQVDSEAALTTSEAKYRSMIAASIDPIYICGPDYTIQHNNPAMMRILKRDAAGEKCHMALHGLAKPCPDCELPAVMAGKSFTIEKQMPVSDRIFMVSHSPVYNDDGSIHKMSVLRDITRRKQIEQELENQEEFLRTLVDSSMDPIVTEDTDRKITNVNRAFLELYGYSANEVLGRSSILLYETREDYEKFGKEVLPAVNERGFWRGERQFRKKDGSLVDTEVAIASHKGSQGSVFGYVSIYRDLTERKQSQKSLKENEEKYRTLFESANDAIFLIADDRIMDCNAKMLKMFECSRDWILGQSPDILSPLRQQDGTDSKTQARQRTKTAIQGEPQFYQWQYRRFDGSLFDAEVSLNVLHLAAKDYLIAIVHDITQQRLAEEERKKLENELMQSQKMEAIGTLAGGIAHDFNNILSAIIGYSELLQINPSLDKGTQSKVKQILKAGIRARDLVQQILTFSRKTEQELKPIQVDLIVDEVLKLLRATLPSNIEIERQLDSKALIMGDPTQIHQVVMNLCTNAGHAMKEDGGKLKVELCEIEAASLTAAKSLDMEPGAYLNLIISDNGTGMEPYVLERIFEPFFTTKDRDEGTGMGLSVVHGIVKSMGGMIYADSEHGRGSSFNVYFPVMQMDNEIKSVEPDFSAYEGTETILLVDDERVIADVAGEMLNMLGYQVVIKTDSREALTHFQNNPHRFDLVLADVTMPELTGDKLAEKMLGIRPDLPIILATGFSSRLSDQKARDIGVRTMIPKPFVMNQLAKTIRQVLDGDMVD